MRLLSRMAVAIVSAWVGVHVNPVAAQSFQDRFSIVPKAHAAEPSSEPGKPAEPAQQTQSPPAAEPTRGSENRSATRSFKRSFSGTAAYSYRAAKTAAHSRSAAGVREPRVRLIVRVPVVSPTPWDYYIVPRYRYRPQDDRIDPYGPPAVPVVRYGPQEVTLPGFAGAAFPPP
jgi:hypothetical protein